MEAPQNNSNNTQVNEETKKADIETAEKMFTDAMELFKKNELDQAIDCFTTALELRTKYVDDHHSSLGDLYFNYAKALLQKAQISGDMFGDAAKQKIEEREMKKLEIADGEGEENEGEVGEKEKDAAEEKEAETKEETKENEKEEEEGGEGEEEEGEEGDEEEGDEEEGEEGGEEAGPSDLDLAWEILETARIIFSKDPSLVQKLSDVHQLLGETAMENDNMEIAIAEFTKCLQLRKEMVPVDNRLVAEAHFYLALAYENQPPPETEEGQQNNIQAAVNITVAIEHLNSARTLLQKELETTTNEKTIEELKGTIKELNEKIESLELVPEEQPTADGQAAPSAGFQFTYTPPSQTQNGFAAPQLPSSTPVNTLAPKRKSAATAAANGDSESRKRKAEDDLPNQPDAKKIKEKQ